MIMTAIATKNNTNNANGYSYFKVAAPPIAPAYRVQLTARVIETTTVTESETASATASARARVPEIAT